MDWNNFSAAFLMDEQHLPTSLLLPLIGDEDQIDYNAPSLSQHNETHKQTEEEEDEDEDEGDDDTFFKIPPNTCSHSTKTYRFYGNELLGRYPLASIIS